MNLDWMEDAACAYTDPEMFFPPEKNDGLKRMVYKAKKICQGCPVLETCRDYALNHDEHMHGVWGGMSEPERRVIRRRLGRRTYVRLAFLLYEDQVHAGPQTRERVA